MAGFRRAIALMSALGIVVLWAGMALGGRGGGLARTAGPPFWLAWAIFTGLALAAIVGVLRRSPLVTLLAGFVSLVPVGLYFLALPGVVRWIGVLNVTLVAAAVAGWVGVRRDEGRA